MTGGATIPAHWRSWRSRAEPYRNDPRIFELTGYILRRRGQQEEGLRDLQRAVELDPRNFETLQQIAGSYQLLGRYAESIAALDRVRLPSFPTTSKRARIVTCFISTGKETLGRSTRRLILFSRKDRAPLPAPLIRGSPERSPNAMGLRPNARLSQWVTTSAGAKARSF